jgi:hypothetical protein
VPGSLVRRQAKGNDFRGAQISGGGLPAGSPLGARVLLPVRWDSRTLLHARDTAFLGLVILRAILHLMYVLRA